MTARPVLTRPQRAITGAIIVGALIIAAIGFTGSYTAVRTLAERKGLGDFASAFPFGVDAGICVLLALDLLLTWLRIPFPLLRQTAWLLTAATIAFNGATAWPDLLGVGMHAVIPVLFIVVIEAARHGIGRIADITADKHMEGVRLTRWLLSPVPTFLLWRRMKLWELRSYEQTIRLEQERLIYQARLRSRFGRAWRRKAPIESLMPLRLARYGVRLAETAPAGLAAAGIDPVLLPQIATSTKAEPAAAGEPTAPALAEATEPTAEAYFDAFRAATRQLGGFPGAQQLDMHRRDERFVLDEERDSSRIAQPDAPAPATEAFGFDQVAEDALALVAAPALAHPHSDRSTSASAPGHPATTARAVASGEGDAPASAEPLATGALVLDLAEMRPVPRDLTADAHSDARTYTALGASARASASATDEELIERILATRGSWPLRRMQREFRIGQARAQRIRTALRTRTRSEPGAPASASAEDGASAPDAPASARTAS